MHRFCGRNFLRYAADTSSGAQSANGYHSLLIDCGLFQGADHHPWPRDSWRALASAPKVAELELEGIEGSNRDCIVA